MSYAFVPFVESQFWFDVASFFDFFSGFRDLMWKF